MDDLTTRRIRVFEQRYGKKALELAYHAAFPLTVSSDLLYCLRETFVPDSPWYAVADVLLSGLCQTIGYDLYEMEEDTRNVLIKKLREHKNFGEPRLHALSHFMSCYILNRFQQETNEYRRNWLPLSYLMANGEGVNAIKKQLINLLTALPQDDEERIKWKTLEEKYADLLREKGFEPLLLKLEDKPEDKPILDDEAKAIAAAIGVKLKPFEYDVVIISPTFKFKTVTVNARGEIINTEPNQAIYYLEFLGDKPGEPSELGIEMVAIPGGEFVMGSPSNELEHLSSESPQHQVTIQPFFIGKYQVTQAQWQFVAQLPQINREIKSDPSRFKGANRPVESVNWYEAVEFCSRLSEFTGRNYRLPSEAEWEYACRAGTTTPFHFGETITTELANYDGTDDKELNWSGSYGQRPKGVRRGETTEVGSFGVANNFGLYDMHGNVDEWCLDDWHDNYDGAPTDGRAWFNSDELSSKKSTDDITWLNSDESFFNNPGHAVLRGGSWIDDPNYCRSASRNLNVRVGRDVINVNIGFRVVCAVGRTFR